MSDDDFDFIDFDFELSPPPLPTWREIAEEIDESYKGLQRELREIGEQAGLARLAEGDSLGEAVWSAVPQHCKIGGAIWGEIEYGVRLAYGALGKGPRMGSPRAAYDSPEDEL